MKKIESIKVEKKTYIIFLPDNEQPRSAVAYEGVEIESSNMFVFDSKAKWQIETERLSAIHIGDLKKS